MPKAVLGLGSNLGDRELYIASAMDEIEKMSRVSIEKISNIYQTEPFDVISEQEPYLNCCVLVSTDLEPEELLENCLEIEDYLGRVRTEYHGARTMDIDLLLYEDEKRDTEKLRLPHPEIRKRAFVLVPLADIFRDLKAFRFDFERDFMSLDKTGVTLYK